MHQKTSQVNKGGRKSKFSSKSRAMLHIYNPSIQESEMGMQLPVQGQPGLHKFQDSQGSMDIRRLCLKRQTKQQQQQQKTNSKNLKPMSFSWPSGVRQGRKVLQGAAGLAQRNRKARKQDIKINNQQQERESFTWLCQQVLSSACPFLLQFSTQGNIF